MSDTEPIFTDIDGLVTIRAGERIVIELSPQCLGRPPGEIARLVTELAERLPRPGEEAVAESLAAIGELQEAMADGGYEAFSAMARRRLGIEAVPNAAAPFPVEKHDRALAAHLGGVLNSFRETVAAVHEPSEEVLSAEAVTATGDLAVVSTTERTIAEVRIGPAARQRGVEGLGLRLTQLVSEARERLHEQSNAQVREQLPADLVATIDNAEDGAAEDGRATEAFFENTLNAGDDIKRRINERA